MNVFLGLVSIVMLIAIFAIVVGFVYLAFYAAIMIGIWIVPSLFMVTLFIYVIKLLQKKRHRYGVKDIRR